MKTILYNPIFINPLAYFVFPNLTANLEPQTGSSIEPARFAGSIEVRTIGNGIIDNVQYFSNVNEIDLSEFSNSWIRISQHTLDGSIILGEWRLDELEEKPYIDPEVLASLVAVVPCFGKTNNDSDRSTVKNLVDPNNPFVISNAAYNLNSGFGKYEVDFTTFNSNSSYVSNLKQDSFDVDKNDTSVFILYKYINSSSLDTPSFKIKVSNLVNSVIYAYINDNGVRSSFSIKENGEYVLPKSYNSLTNNETWIGFRQESNVNCQCTITQIPSFEGAFVTDGIDDLITSTKTVQEMLGGSNEVTVVSMIHQIKESVWNDRAYTNYINGTNGHIRNQVANTKTGIYGYIITDFNPTSVKGRVVNDILGDKNDYEYDANTSVELSNAKYSVQNYTRSDGTASNIGSQLAWYWTIIANKVLTTDQINQVIAYFNLDRCIKPDVLYDIKKQGITNENHAEFNDKLIDFSGNERDMQLNNIAWKGGSGIAAKLFETIKDYSIILDEGTQELTIYNEFSYKIKSNMKDRYWAVQTLNRTDVSYPINIVTDKDIIWRNAINYTDENGIKGSIRKETNVPANTPTQIQVLGFNDFDVPDNYTKINCVSYATRTDITEFIVTFIPSCKGGILLDGIEDFGKVIGLPIYKDYTVIADYQRTDINLLSGGTSSILSKSSTGGNGSFIMNLINSTGTGMGAIYSFGQTNVIGEFTDLDRDIYYQSKYLSQGTYDLNVGIGVDERNLFLGTVRDNDSRFFKGVIYYIMMFPYSMSKFLIERQLKNNKLGTLYPDFN